ncbi:transcription elongation factor Elf1 like-domain-containing protein [Tuber indicum]|nr:transcription elongation factor Elf1 like-domain-containing protein [Tuber indicum]
MRQSSEIRIQTESLIDLEPQGYNGWPTIMRGAISLCGDVAQAGKGKRKRSSRKPTVFKKKEPLATTFMCLFCNNQDTVACVLDKTTGIGSLSCRACGQRFRMSINYLSAPIDVYSEWVDACDEIENPKVKVSRRAGASSRDGGRGDREEWGGAAKNKTQRNHVERGEQADEDSDDNSDGYGAKV